MVANNFDVCMQRRSNKAAAQGAKGLSAEAERRRQVQRPSAEAKSRRAQELVECVMGLEE